MMPANAGAAKDVPPATRNPNCSRVHPMPGGFASDWQKKYALRLRPLPAKSDTSGTSRAPSLGTPFPVCHGGLGYPPLQVKLEEDTVEVTQLLGPPPPPTRSLPSSATTMQPLSSPDRAQESFQVISGI